MTDFLPRDEFLEKEPDKRPGECSPGSSLIVEHDGRIANLRLNRPHAGNVLDGDLLEELLSALKQVRRTGQTRVIVLSGAGADFCTGADMGEFATAVVSDRTGNEVRHLLSLGRAVCQELARSEAVTIGQLQGRVIGAGLALAVHCDLRVSSDSATFRLPELTLGFPPVWGGSSARLINEIGAARLRELLLIGDRVDATFAYTYGIAHRVCPESELGASVRKLGSRLSRRDEVATKTAKHLFAASEAVARLGDITTLEDDLFWNSLRERSKVISRKQPDSE